MTKHGRVHDCFVGVGAKFLSAADADSGESYHHEISTTQDMRNLFLGKNQKEFKTVFIWTIQERDDECYTEDGSVTHYDARAKGSRKPKWRLRFRSNWAVERMREGDALFLALGTDEILYFIATPAGLTGESQLSWLFGLRPEGQDFVSRKLARHKPEPDLAVDLIFEDIGLPLKEPSVSSIGARIAMSRMLGTSPYAPAAANLARSNLPEVDPKTDPDGALMAWTGLQKEIFRRMMHSDPFARLEAAFREEEKIVESHEALENHLEDVFRAWKISYDRNAVTEYDGRLSFLFPGEEAYRNASAGDPSLIMLDAVSSYKYFWWQILDKAEKMTEKHLLIFTPGISESGTDSIKENGIQLVVPRPLHVTYTKKQQAWLWDVADFIKHVRKQSGK